jgi:hypothetical protein
LEQLAVRELGVLGLQFRANFILEYKVRRRRTFGSIGILGFPGLSLLLGITFVVVDGFALSSLWCSSRQSVTKWVDSGSEGFAGHGTRELVSDGRALAHGLGDLAKFFEELGGLTIRIEWINRGRITNLQPLILEDIEIGHCVEVTGRVDAFVDLDKKEVNKG